MKIFKLFLISILCTSQLASANVSLDEATEVKRTSNFNVQIKPLALIYGAFGAEIHFALGEKFNIGLGGSSYVQTTRTRERTYYDFGVMAAYRLSGRCFQTGWKAESSLNFVRTRSHSLITGLPTTSTLAIDGNYLATTLNHVWTWNSNFNLQMGAGASFSLSDSEELFEPLLVWKVGYAF